MSDQPTIIHLDLDSFFVSVERLARPDLRGVPVLVGGRPEARGVVASASYEARAFGCRSAMPMSTALRLCPQAIVVAPSRGRYSHYSRQVMALLGEITPLVEQVSVDEAYFDVRGCELRSGPPLTIAQSLQRRIRDEVGLPASFGLGANKLIAKLASEKAKPNGIFMVALGTEQHFLAPLPVRDLPGVGPATAERLRALGITTVGQVAALEQATLVRLFGEAGGTSLFEKSRAISSSPVAPEHRPKNISQETTFAHDIAHREAVERHLLAQADAVAARLRDQGFQARTITLKLRFADFTTISRSQTLPTPTDLPTPIYEAARTMLAAAWQQGRAVRLVGVGASNLLDHVGYQLDLFDQHGHDEAREAKLTRTLDDLRERFGKNVVKRARLLDDTEE